MRFPLNLVTLMFGKVVRVRLVISIMFPMLGLLAVVGGCWGWAGRRGSTRGVGGPGPRGGTKPGTAMPGGDSTLGRRDPEESEELPELPLSEGGGLKRRTRVGELSLLAVSGALLSMLAMWCPGVLGLFTLKFAHLNLASQAL